MDFEPVRTVADLEGLDAGEVLQGYMDYRQGDPEPGENRGRAYWHGWCNGRRDAGHAPPSAESAALAHELRQHA